LSSNSSAISCFRLSSLWHKSTRVNKVSGGMAKFARLFVRSSRISVQNQPRTTAAAAK
jgi:hypothetical protein